jgi:ParB family chromosome partitioning protein
MIQVENLYPNPDNPRTDLGDLAALERSIRTRGLDQPITVRPKAGEPNKFWIEDGERRYRAMMEWNTEIPAIVKPLRPGERPTVRNLLAAIVTGTTQKPLDPIERAKAYTRLYEEADMTQRQIADQVGLTDATINSYMLLMELSPSLQNSVQTGKITVREGAAMVKRARANIRRAKGQKPMMPVWDPPWFTRKHPLSGYAVQRCAVQDHSLRRRRGKERNWPGACEQCWQAVIEEHARAGVLERCAALIAASNPAQAEKWRREAETLRS